MTVGVRSPIEGVNYIPLQTLEYYVSNGALSDETLYDRLGKVARKFPNRIALSEPGLTVTYSQFDRITDQVAAALVRLGIEPLNRILLQIVNSKELLYVFIGAIKAGAIPICTLTAHRENEIGQIGRQADAKAHIVSKTHKGSELVEFAAAMRAKIPSLEHLLVAGTGEFDGYGATSLEDLWCDEHPEEAKQTVARIREQIDPYQVCVFQLSGGTSGTPKIIPRFHNEYGRTALDVAEFFGFDEEIITFTPNPMLHNMPMVCFILPALLIGGEVAIAAGGTMEAAAQIVVERRPQWCAVGLAHILKLQEMKVIDETTFEDAYGFICLERAAQFSQIIGAPAYTIYGMTEGLLCFTKLGDPEQAIKTTVGRSVSVFDEIKLCHPESDKEVEPGAVGELLIRGPSTIRGYYDAPEKNAEVFTSDGYYRSGDLMSWKIVEGIRYLAFEGRVKDVVDRGGEKISCPELELAINTHEKVKAVMCVAMPDPIYGERLCAYLIPNTTNDDITVADLANHLESLGFAKFKFPERVEIVDSFPIAANGKPSKPMLRKMITDKLLAEAQLESREAENV